MRRSSSYARKRGIDDLAHHKINVMPYDHRTVLKYPHKYELALLERAREIEFKRLNPDKK